MGAATVQEICHEVGVTATAVRQRLSRLQPIGLVSREAVRSGRGRPHHTYRVTDAGLKELGDNYSDLAVILWSELHNIEDSAVRRRVLNRVRQALVSRYGRDVDGGSLGERLQQLKSVLIEQGFDVEIDTSGDLPVLRENNCPYLDLASCDTEICELEQSVFGKILGADVHLAHCCLDGHSCCEFEAAEAGASVD